jgi:hypothetical protein
VRANFVRVHTRLQVFYHLRSAAGFREGKGEIEFPEIPGSILEKVIEYFHYKVRSLLLVHLLEFLGKVRRTRAGKIQ